MDTFIETFPRKPVVCLVIGMAGSGKSTFMQQMAIHLASTQKKGYFVNLDPAVQNVPFPASIDIRDSVNYNQIMMQYGLGPNGAILTSLNVFATMIEQFVQILQTKSESTDFIFIDTPGQIEAFTWSSSGQIISDTLASLFPTTLLYIVDVPRSSESNTTWTSNMLYACSILYKSRLPLICVMNKIDMSPADRLLAMMRADGDEDDDNDESNGHEPSSYMTSLTSSLRRVLYEFYKVIKGVGVSSVTGEGFSALLSAVQQAADEDFRQVFLADYASKLMRRQDEGMKSLENFRTDLKIDNNKK